MDELSPLDIRRALDGDVKTLRRLVDGLMPVVQSRAGRAVARFRPSSRDPRQEVEDIVQEIFAALFEQDGRALRTWDPSRGLSLRNFVGLVSQRTAYAVLKSGKRTPWPDDPTSSEVLESRMEMTTDPTARIDSRAHLEDLLEKLRQTLSPQGLVLFHRLCIQQEEVQEVASTMGMTEQAVYAFRRRLEKTAQRLSFELSAEPVSSSMLEPAE